MKNIITAKVPERVVLVGTIYKSQDEKKVKEYLDELEFLTYTAGGIVIKKFTQKLDAPNPATFIGKGKLDEIKKFVEENNINLIIFDDELTPSQIKNIEKHIGVRVLDRTTLILDIFAQQAKTSYAKIQVELAQYQHLLPRLTRMWTHLERQRGGIGLRGPGETEIETDRRRIKAKIANLKKQLADIDQQMMIQRSNRGKLVRVALIGYTNVGKSTLMNLFSKTNILAENKLFATLDTTVRKVIIKNLPFLLTDTVGFIRKLPHTLVESFKSTLDEVREADILLHIIDISHPNFLEQIQIVLKTLLEINAINKPIINVFNKIDLYKDENFESDLNYSNDNIMSLEYFKKTWIAQHNEPCVFISATKKINIDELRDILYNEVKKIHITRYPFNDFIYEETIDDLNYQ